MLTQLKSDLKKLGSKEKAQHHMQFFKTQKGEYGEGDQFIGVTVPEQRTIAKKYKDLSLTDIESLLHSDIHEHRLTALFIMVYQFKKGDNEKQKHIVDMYIKNAKRINNWDLVDSSAPYILGPYLLDKDRKIVYKLAKSRNLWEQRIGIMSTFAFIKDHDYKDTLEISKMLLHHKHDLIHKAVGWMLREVGNRDKKTEEAFLKKYYKSMNRTMLRYAVEKFPENIRKKYFNNEI